MKQYHLSKGAHRTAADGRCAMEWVAYLAHEPHMIIRCASAPCSPPSASSSTTRCPMIAASGYDPTSHGPSVPAAMGSTNNGRGWRLIG